jgi:hypothetical protein
MAKSQSDSSNQSSKREKLPFEPSRGSKNPEDKANHSRGKRSSTMNTSASATSQAPTKRRTVSSTGIPDAVSRRMVRRMVIMCGIPTILGILTFLVSYQVVVHDLIELPHTAVLLVSLGFFGLGVLGLSYGALSASWDEARDGGILGWSEFQTNFQRMTQAWQSEQKS